MNRHMSEINLPIFAWLMSTKLVQKLTDMESPLWTGLGTGLAEGVNLRNMILEMGGVKEGLQEAEQSFGAYV